MTLECVLKALKDLRDGNFRRRLVLGGDGLSTEVAAVFNELADRNQLLVGELMRVRSAAGREGAMEERLTLADMPGGWGVAADSVNGMIEDLARPATELSRVLAAVAEGDLAQRMPPKVGATGGCQDFDSLSGTVNGLLDQLSLFASEVTRVAREIGSDGKLGGQAQVPGVAGTWRDLTDSVNLMAAKLSGQVRDISQVAKAVAGGDLSRKITVEVSGEILELKDTINTMVDQLSAFADEVTRVAREVGSEGRLGGQARARGVAGTWKDLTDNVNIMAENLTSQVRSIATVATAVAGGDMSKKITVEAKGEVAALAETINGMVDTLRAFADEVTRVAREVGTEGKLGGQARVPGVAGTWKDLTDNVNSMANNLTGQVRNIAQVTTAVARGDLSRKIDVDARGEILELKTTINTMVDRLSAFASEVTRVAREVGTEGRLGGQAEVLGVSGTWQRLTESVNRLAGNLTTQVRAIAGVATAVTAGDLTRQITVCASGEVAELKDNINQMIANLKETTRTNQEQDWLKTNLARISGLMQGHRDLAALTSLIMSELAPLVCAQYGAFFLAVEADDGTVGLERTAGYGLESLNGDAGSRRRFRLGESLVGQAAMDKRTILMTGAPPNYIKISSGLGCAAPVNLIVLPVRFEGRPLGVIELASVNEFTDVHRDLLEQLKETIGVNVNTILATSRTEALLTESQRLAQDLRARSEQLQKQQDELRRSNMELAEKAKLLASQNHDIEIKNRKIEQASRELSERARQLSMASEYKSEFLANMSHELRTPLNSALILAKVLADNIDGNLTLNQVELARTIYSAGHDLLQLINDVLDLAKVEAGHMEIQADDVEINELVGYVESLYRPLATEKGLDFAVALCSDLPASLKTDKHRLQQILRNLLSNAVKFTDEGGVRLHIRMARPAELTSRPLLDASGVIAFCVEDTGIGIPADKLALVFEAFQQADGTTSRKYGGTGLGLSISRELTRLLGGELQVDSEPGRGSTFTLRLSVEALPATDIPVVSGLPDTLDETGILLPPLDEAEVMRRRSARDDEVTHSGIVVRGDEERVAPTAFHGEKVLIVDDDQRTVFALTTLLRERGLTVVNADNGVSGIRMLTECGDIALMLVDVMMPELDGNATTAAVREMPGYGELPIIAVTAKAMKGDREKCLAFGATDYVTKPVNINELLELIARHLCDGDAVAAPSPETGG